MLSRDPSGSPYQRLRSQSRIRHPPTPRPLRTSSFETPVKSPDSTGRSIKRKKMSATVTHLMEQYRQ
ncbi:unnamed protein product [Bursaphelenchus xylophilus]|uniref:(pine wood nematode) hypothetical protein n=1 Tax=Bursaphelenchus xylophilus TaxID=6326 RepID=A0A1I7RQS4_BURXY|nr:unnamed protein product [Bursaphelenchus xylophilus]CAG9105033.1 unnamed protein product [Bursaphelenchus xylophilus]